MGEYFDRLKQLRAAKPNQTSIYGGLYIGPVWHRSTATGIHIPFSIHVKSRTKIAHNSLI